jgi:hypothetical protein
MERRYEMTPLRDFSYGNAEPIWILKNDEEDEESGSGSSDTTEKQEFSPLASDGSYLATDNEGEDEQNLPYASRFYNYYNISGDEKEKEIVVNVPVCCGSCVDSV